MLTRHQRLAGPRTVEIELPLNARPAKGARLVKRDGWMLWRVRVPANGAAELRYRVAALGLRIDGARAVVRVQRDEGEQASVTLTSVAPRSRWAMTSIRTPIEVRPTRSTSA